MRLDAVGAARFSAAAKLTGGFERHLAGDERCWPLLKSFRRAILPRNRRESGECRLKRCLAGPKQRLGFRKTRHRGLARVGWMFTLTATAYNLVRLPKLVGARA
jgi:hypothetical protein